MNSKDLIPSPLLKFFAKGTLSGGTIGARFTLRQDRKIYWQKWKGRRARQPRASVIDYRNFLIRSASAAVSSRKIFRSAGDIAGAPGAPGSFSNASAGIGRPMPSMKFVITYLR